MNILEEAILEANQVRDIAYANAHQAIKETFQPRIQRMITSKLAEEGDGEDEFADENPEMTDPAMAAPVAPAADPAMVAPVAPVPTAPAADPAMADPAMAAPVAPVTDPAMAAPAEDEEDEMSEEFRNLVAELSMDDEMTDPAQGEDELQFEGILDDNVVLEIDEFENDADPNLSISAPNPTNLQMENTRLKKELSDTRRANVILKTAMNEVNLLNAKLMYASKAAHNFELSENQQVKLLKTFDSAKTIREVKLVYSALVESYQVKEKVRSKNNTKLTESLIPASASRTVNTVARQTPDKGELPFANRWKELANIKKIQH